MGAKILVFVVLALGALGAAVTVIGEYVLKGMNP